MLYVLFSRVSWETGGPPNNAGERRCGVKPWETGGPPNNAGERRYGRLLTAGNEYMFHLFGVLLFAIRPNMIK